MAKQHWKLLGSECLREYSTLRVNEDKYQFQPTGAEAGFVVCDSADWVLVIPITDDGQVVFVRQYRHAYRDVVLEIPGGVMDPGESPAETARRELREETGYVAKTIEMFEPLLPNPALNSARCHFALATGCQAEETQQLDPFESIEVELRPLAEVDAMIRNRELQHALCVVAFAVTQALR
jgi:8-oxo-dGTP pyrophosphatase MutT (NUDIX family)